MITFNLFVYGIVFGSFFNVVGLRVPIKKSIVAPRSACPTCGHQLRAWELIPVGSYLIQGGKCRGCQSRISPIYPITELITGVLFALAPIFVGWTYELVVALTLISLLMIIFVSDIHYMLIPDKILLVFSGIFLFERFFTPLTPWWDSILGATVGFLLLFAIMLISKGGMGGGDVKLYGVLGFVLGTKLVLLSFFLATLFGAVIGIFAMLIKLVERRQPIPFGPFIVAGTLFSYFYGEELIDYYLNFITYGF
ncbi:MULTISPECIES: A24 family peptidase [unclassified Bacillus (in: firmicutes)]|uniref:prepilin peptidase n=1 Tax=unclassified Bacillus (in: firmicutes) TaxID=185979 RepID=UPI0008E9F9FD|nr:MULTISPECIES: A24 family peptidase [unclassified Bacillus (in: firmicutes)]SFB16278.1 leader peptidase (prepilin peptidase) / N-methyltransferase [Bacillus sp. UNCCL13]SFQ78163.1 leader peptidase (prepilin peptidase) / N-methyltransferase [Bacillus sp. cl95]